MKIDIPRGEFLFDADPAMGRYRTYHIDPATHQHTITTHQYVPEELNRRKYNDDTGGWKGDFHHVASVPGNILFDLLRKGIIDDPKAFSRWLNDPDNRVFRTKAGII